MALPRDTPRDMALPRDMLSMDDVREFLWGEVKERKKLRAENLAAKIF